MTLLKFQTLLANVSFSFLFLLMLFSWIKQSFSILKNKNNWEITVIFFVNICLILLLISRWVDQHHYPLSNLYESLIFLSWSITSLHLVLVHTYKFGFIGIITYPIAFFILAFAEISLPLEMQKVTSLVPALQSNWLMMHVTIMMLSYSALLLGSLFAIAFLILTSLQNSTLHIIAGGSNKQTPLEVGGSFKIKSPSGPVIKNKSEYDVEKDRICLPLINVVKQTEAPRRLCLPMFSFETNFFSGPSFVLRRVTTKKNISFYSEPADSNKLPEILDNLSYRTLGLGFPLLTIGILSGAVWANEAWGSYWSWDVKETWAFITWLVFAIYLHTRITKGWKGKKPAVIASFGFFIVWVCYLGVNILGQGLHSYGWFF